jgi:tRNA threonylcarbamoyladenosine biosynthesis protein TsaE
MADFTVVSHSPEQTRRLGSILGALAQGNDIYLLSGNLGTGKTHLVQGIAFGLGVKEYACSPSFMIAREYHGRLDLYHLDLYRLDHIEEIVDLGLDEYFHSGSVCAIEWAEKGSGVLPVDNLTVELEHMGANDRRITFLPQSSHYKQLIRMLRETIEKDTEDKWN